MIKKILFLCFAFLFYTNYVFSNESFLDREKLILDGLSKKKLSERILYLDKAKYTNSLNIFNKLVLMYKINNNIKENVFMTMKEMNVFNNGKFSREFIEAADEEFQNLHNEKKESHEDLFYLQTLIAYCIDYPYDQFDSYIKKINNEIDNYLVEITDFEAKKNIKNNILGLCSLYMALKKVPDSLKKLAYYYINGADISESKVISIFTLEKNSSIYEFLTNKIKNNLDDEYTLTLLDDYVKYSEAIGKTLSKEINEKHNTYNILLKQKADKLFEGIK